jgi:hypothetical protein
VFLTFSSTILSKESVPLGVTTTFYERLGFIDASESERGITFVAGDAKLFLFETQQTDQL